MHRRNVFIVFILIGLLVTSSLVYYVFVNTQPPEENNRVPVVSIDDLNSGSIVSGIVTVNVTVDDEEALTATIAIDTVYTATTNSYQWNTTAIPDGKHTIRVAVEDSFGLRDIAHVQVIVDNVVETPFSFDDTFKVMVYNIKESGLNDDWKTVVKAESPDILVLVETGLLDDYSFERFNGDVSELNEYFSETPYAAFCARNVRYSTSGEAILSRFPIVNFTQLPVLPLDDGSDYDVTHDFIDAVVDINGTEVHVIGAHLKASGGETNEDRRELETEGILNYMDNLGEVPILYLSDQNSFSPADSGTLAPQGTMELGYGPNTLMLFSSNMSYGNHSSQIHTFIDVFRTLNPTDPGYTFGHQTSLEEIRIDYIIANTFFAGIFLNSSVVTASPADTASDHYAVTAIIHW